MMAEGDTKHNTLEQAIAHFSSVIGGAFEEKNFEPATIPGPTHYALFADARCSAVMSAFFQDVISSLTAATASTCVAPDSAAAVLAPMQLDG